MKKLLLALAFVGACAHPPPHLDPTIYHANEAVVGIGSAQRAAIELNKICRATPPAPCDPILSTEATRVVVDASTDALTTLKSVPDGWRATVDVFIVRVEARLDAAGKGQLKPYLEALRIIVKGGVQ